MAIRLAGNMKLDAATGRLIDFLPEFDILGGRLRSRALSRIGTDSVVKQLAARFIEDEELRPAIASLLQNFYSDACVETCRELLDASKTTRCEST